MKLIIDINEKDYKFIKQHCILKGYFPMGWKEIANGTPLPKGHGRLIDEKEAINIIAEGKNDYEAYFGTVNKDWEVIDFLKTVPTIIEADKEK